MSAPRFNLDQQAERGWLERSARAATMLATLAAAEPGLRRLADIGCGDTKLRRSLAARDIQLAYQGFDLLPQRPDVLPFDLSTDSLSEPFDVVVLLGVTEYLPDLAGTLARLKPSCRHLLLSHVLKSAKSPSPQRLAELGWRQHLTDEQLQDCIASADFRIRDRDFTPDGRTRLLLCDALRVPA
jgi:hypothetical protein